VADGTPEELQGTRTTLVRALDQAMLAAALKAAEQPFTSASDGSLAVEATTEQVGRIAAGSGAVLTELREQGEDLEELFLSLTTNNTQEVAA
jgi:ABC-2 type transport system ATP-binding protein